MRSWLIREAVIIVTPGIVVFNVWCVMVHPQLFREISPLEPVPAVLASSLDFNQELRLLAFHSAFGYLRISLWPKETTVFDMVDVRHSCGNADCIFDA
jgi:hypothetical protein